MSCYTGSWEDQHGGARTQYEALIDGSHNEETQLPLSYGYDVEYKWAIFPACGSNKEQMCSTYSFSHIVVEMVAI